MYKYKESPTNVQVPNSHPALDSARGAQLWPSAFLQNRPQSSCDLSVNFMTLLLPRVLSSPHSHLVESKGECSSVTQLKY